MTLQKFEIIPRDTTISDEEEAQDAILAGLPNICAALNAAGFHAVIGDPSEIFGYEIKGTIPEYVLNTTICCEIDNYTRMIFSFGAGYNIVNSSGFKLGTNSITTNGSLYALYINKQFNSVKNYSTVVEGAYKSSSVYTGYNAYILRDIVVINHKIVLFLNKDGLCNNSIGSTTSSIIQLRGIYLSAYTTSSFDQSSSIRTYAFNYINGGFYSVRFVEGAYSTFSTSYTKKSSQDATLYRMSLDPDLELYGVEDTYYLYYPLFADSVNRDVVVINYEEYYVIESIAIKIQESEEEEAEVVG